MLKNNTNNFFE